MSILIKGLDIPKGEHERITIQIGSDGDVYLVTDFELKSEVYKFNAVEVPESHGRLIDATQAYRVMLEEMCGTGYQARACSVLMHENETPTVIDEERKDVDATD